MRFAIVENGGKQYRAVEGSTIEVDRMPVEAGTELSLERILLLADGDEVMVGTPIVGGINVKATVVDHFKGPKVVRFKYRPKKRIRVKGGHRHQYTRLMIDFIGKPGEERKVEEPAAQKEAEAAVEMVEAVKEPKAAKQAKVAAKTPKKTAEKKPAAKTGKVPAKKSTAKKTEKK
jgi:large subunit ribosomal protein L21